MNPVRIDPRKGSFRLILEGPNRQPIEPRDYGYEAAALRALRNPHIIGKHLRPIKLEKEDRPGSGNWAEVECFQYRLPSGRIGFYAAPTLHLMWSAPVEAFRLMGAMFRWSSSTGTASPLQEIQTAFRRLHPGNPWSETLVVDSPLMDRIYRPHLQRGVDWLFPEFCNGLRDKFGVREESLKSHEGALREAFSHFVREARADPRGVESENPSSELEGALGLQDGTLRDQARSLWNGRGWVVALGCCVLMDWATIETLSQNFDLQLLKGLAGKAVCILDSERIWKRGQALIGTRPGRRNDVGPERLGWVVWTHEQSHATRPGESGPPEEVHAQLDTYRALDSIASPPYSRQQSYREVMECLSKHQPPEYRAVFLDDFRSAMEGNELPAQGNKTTTVDQIIPVGIFGPTNLGGNWRA